MAISPAHPRSGAHAWPMTGVSSVSLLVGRAREGDHGAFEELVRPLLPRAVGSALLITGNMSDAEDAAQDALLAAWRDVSTVRSPDAFPAWFRWLVVRAAVRRAIRRRKDAAVGLDAVPLDSLHDSVEHGVWLRQAFAALSPNDRAVVTARYYFGYSTAETAALLGVPVGTVKSRLHYALGRLRIAGTGGDE